MGFLLLFLSALVLQLRLEAGIARRCRLTSAGNLSWVRCELWRENKSLTLQK